MLRQPGKIPRRRRERARESSQLGVLRRHRLLRHLQLADISSQRAILIGHITQVAAELLELPLQPLVLLTLLVEHQLVFVVMRLEDVEVVGEVLVSTLERQGDQGDDADRDTDDVEEEEVEQDRREELHTVREQVQRYVRKAS